MLVGLFISLRLCLFRFGALCGGYCGVVWFDCLFNYACLICDQYLISALSVVCDWMIVYLLLWFVWFLIVIWILDLN